MIVMKSRNLGTKSFINPTAETNPITPQITRKLEAVEPELKK